jgi:hypothetical protein
VDQKVALDWPKGMQQGTEVAELLWGAVMGVTQFVAAVL